MTAFVGELIEERRVYRTLFASLEANSLDVGSDYASGPSTSQVVEMSHIVIVTVIEP